MRWLAGLALALSAQAAGAQPLVLWAWERPEDLRFAGREVEIAAQTGFIELSGDRLIVRGRRHPLQAGSGQVTTAVVHLQIDPRRRLVWTPERQAQVAQAVLRLARRPGVRRLQLDFEVRASERPILLAVLRGVRAGLPEGIELSMTALASWCDTETWLDQAPVDEIVPMLFRMGPGGERLKARLAAGGDFANPRCRGALAVSTDTPLARAPAGRRVYLFNPRSWTAASFERTRRGVAAWPVG
ncbi:hypothetical protein [Phenylobacterium sp.]|uniref:hypothetical protein n=1 Tax=Phenylobacterium sp. TaxID=1871053 RepID=UPI0025DBBA1B|nr:hypothetical protein [Phenylobacterium sp.]